jgi:disulfide bond formation protein DsbB
MTVAASAPTMHGRGLGRWRADLWFGGIALVSLAAVAAALVLQYRWNMQPCPWCILQRVIFVAIAAAGLLALLWRGRVGAIVGAIAVLLLALAGAAAALWQHFVAASAESCALTLAERIVSGLTLDERWPEVFTAYASCKDAAVKLLGLPFEFWSLGLFVAIGVVAIGVLRRPA